MDRVAGETPSQALPEDPRELAILWRNRFLMLFDHLPLPIAVCDTAGRIHVVNRAMGIELGVLPGHLSGRKILELLRPQGRRPLRPVMEAVRLQRRSQYPIEVLWAAADGTERRGELTIEPVSDLPDDDPKLLLWLRALGPPATAPADRPTERVSPVEARILAAAARGATTAQIAREVDLTVDGVNYHLTRLTRRWHVPNRTALVARAYATGVLAPDTWPPRPSADGTPSG
ncbi:PAS domain S-box-containing protein [Kitasatospora sp. GP30]|jgi:PAS domain S-box-containing protein|uniref:PAS domain-containing protein n=1 Tax=Kitasatospora sp. GP30 TaxID=3035084 RepID=UPI000C6FF6EE|nr:PAS domain-containing protein [Kitasatospora sp. GP30]MDH6140443.1 PAS domain S-box-containing protein [Kitasatospora sp. GP30]